MVKILDLKSAESQIHTQAARLLQIGFEGTGSDCWAAHSDAVAEIRKALGEDRLARFAVGSSGEVLGWVGAISQYNGNVWELHPLVVHPEHRGRGIAKALVIDLENEVSKKGGSTLWLGTDDESSRTSLGGATLYPDVLTHLQKIQNLRSHPYEFYKKLGFSIVGVLPDANGPGKPDIFMAKRVLRN